MPDELFERIDEFADDHGYTGRSEVIRDAARDLLGEFEDARLEMISRDLSPISTEIHLRSETVYEATCEAANTS